MAPNYKLERIAILLILCVALLSFLSPIISLRVPAGDQLGHIYDVSAGLNLLRSNLGVFTTLGSFEERTASASSATETVTIPKPLELPFSLRIVLLPIWLVLAALACAALALLDLLSFRKAVAAISLVGGCLSALALLHLMVMNSDLRSWTAELINSGSLGSPDNPALGTRMLMLNTFHVSPGPGLHSLTVCLFLVPFLYYTRAIPRVRSIVRHAPRTSDSQPIRIRPVNSHYPEEICTSVNLSRSGLYVESASNHYYVGMEVYVTRNVHPGNQTSHEEHGSVVRVERPEGGKCRFAIRIISAV